MEYAASVCIGVSYTHSIERAAMKKIEVVRIITICAIFYNLYLLLVIEGS